MAASAAGRGAAAPRSFVAHLVVVRGAAVPLLRVAFIFQVLCRQVERGGDAGLLILLVQGFERRLLIVSLLKIVGV